MPEISFMLYKPAVGGNVGAAARALKTMGFGKLELIAPCNHLGAEARMLAHGANDVLEQARVYSNFEEALKGREFIIATTAKSRTAKHDYHSSRELRKLLQEKGGRLREACILFGTEESGLPNDLVLRADLAVSIPMAGNYPSLNLAQAVMVVAYELAPLNALNKPGEIQHKSGEGFARLKELSEFTLGSAGIHKGSALYHRIMERMATVGANDIPLFLSVLSRLPEKKD